MHHAEAGAEVERTTIPITNRTRDRLKAVGRMDETYDSLLNRLIDTATAAGQKGAA